MTRAPGVLLFCPGDQGVGAFVGINADDYQPFLLKVTYQAVRSMPVRRARLNRAVARSYQAAPGGRTPTGRTSREATSICRAAKSEPAEMVSMIFKRRKPRRPSETHLQTMGGNFVWVNRSFEHARINKRIYQTSFGSGSPDRNDGLCSQKPRRSEREILRATACSSANRLGDGLKRHLDSPTSWGCSLACP